MIYVSIGSDATKLTTKSLNFYTVTSEFFSSKKEKTILSLMTSMGIESYLYNNINIRTQYSYSDYSKFDHNWEYPNFQLFEKISSKRSIWTVDLVYHIA